MLLYNAELFAGIPQLCATFFLKVFARHAESRRFKALALLFRRTADGVTCVDAISCGTAPLNDKVRRSLPQAILNVLRDLGVPLALYPANPWPAAVNPTVTVPAHDLFYWRDDPTTGAPVLIPGAPAAAADLRICLWRIVRMIDSQDPFS